MKQMINTDDVIRKIMHQAQLALNETNQTKKEAYLYSIQTLSELAVDREGTDAQAINPSKMMNNNTPTATKSQPEALELKKMMGNMYQQNTPPSVQSYDDDEYDQGSGSLLDF